MLIINYNVYIICLTIDMGPYPIRNLKYDNCHTLGMSIEGYIVAAPQCILVTQCIYRGGNVTQCIYPMYIKMSHNVYRKCTTMYPSTMQANLHLQRISKCNQMYIKCNPMYIPLFLLVSECIWWDIHCVAFYIHWGYTL